MMSCYSSFSIDHKIPFPVNSLLITTILYLYLTRQRPLPSLPVYYLCDLGEEAKLLCSPTGLGGIGKQLKRIAMKFIEIIVLEAFYVLNYFWKCILFLSPLIHSGNIFEFEDHWENCL